MGAGVQESAFVILFLSEGVLLRPFVQFEIGEALKCGTPVLFVHEADDRHHPFNFGTEVKHVPDPRQKFLQNFFAKRLL